MNDWEYTWDAIRIGTVTGPESAEKLERFIAEVERAAAEKAWDESGEWLADSWGYPGIKDDAHEANPYREETR